MAEPKSVRAVMLPPAGFVEHAVARGLAEVLAEDALRTIEPEAVVASDRPENDIAPRPPRRRRDSGIISGVNIDDTPTLPFIRTARED